MDGVCECSIAGQKPSGAGGACECPAVAPLSGNECKCPKDAHTLNDAGDACGCPIAGQGIKDDGRCGGRKTLTTDEFNPQVSKDLEKCQKLHISKAYSPRYRFCIFYLDC